MVIKDEKSSQIVGLSPPICWTNFVAGKQYESTEYFGAFPTTMTSQRLSIQNVAPSATVMAVI